MVFRLLLPKKAALGTSRLRLPDCHQPCYGLLAKDLRLTCNSLYKGLYPLWGRQIPYTMMKFASFETIVEAIYGYLPGQKSDYGKGSQMGVSFAGGYLAGILCAIVSHPADVMVSKLNASRQPGEAFGAAMGRIYRDIGFSGLWNGLPVRIVMIGTLPEPRREHDRSS